MMCPDAPTVTHHYYKYHIDNRLILYQAAQLKAIPSSKAGMVIPNAHCVTWIIILFYALNIPSTNT